MLGKRCFDVTRWRTVIAVGQVLFVSGALLVTAGILGPRLLEHPGGFSIGHFLFGVLTGIGAVTLGTSLVVNLRGLHLRSRQG